MVVKPTVRPDDHQICTRRSRTRLVKSRGIV
jgi:hypothetical protein